MTDKQPPVRVISRAKSLNDKLPPSSPPVHPKIFELARLLARQAVQEHLKDAMDES